jgi:RNase H-like domain found in reverse transcriptase/Integrase zinc binding domain
MLNGLTHEGIVLLDSGATGANYIQPTCFEILQHLDPSVNSKYHPAPSRVSLADETTTVKVYGYVHLDISIEDPRGSSHNASIVFKVADLTNRVDCFIGLPTLCTKLKSLFFCCIDSYDPADLQEIHVSLRHVQEYTLTPPYASLLPNAFNTGSYEIHTDVWNAYHEQHAPEESNIPFPVDFAAFIAEHNFETNKRIFLASWEAKICPPELITGPLTPPDQLAYDRFKDFMNTVGFRAFLPGPDGWKFVKGIEVNIDWSEPLPSSFPINLTYPPHALRHNTERYIESLLSYFWVPSDATTLTPILVVAKPGSEFEVRIVAMYNKTVNKYITSYSWAIPSPLDKIMQCHECHWFGTGDLTRAFHQLRLSLASSKALSVATHRGNFRPLGIPEGVKFGSQYLQQFVSHVFADMESFCDAIYDNLFFYAKTLPTFLQRFQDIIMRCIEHDIILSLDKTHFGHSQIQFGMEIDGAGYRVDPTRIDAIRKVQFPTNLSQARSVLGLFNWLSPFVHNYQQLAAPISDMTKQNFDFKKQVEWARDYVADFNKLREACTEGLMKLGIPNYSLDWVTYSDASDIACCGIIVMIDNNGQQIPIQLCSHKFSDVACRWMIIQKEAYSIFFNYKRGINILLGKSHSCMTDHANLLQMNKSERPVIQNIVLFLQRFNIREVLHVPGNKNPADFPTRSAIDGQDDLPMEEILATVGIEQQSEINIEETILLAESVMMISKPNKRFIKSKMKEGVSRSEAIEMLCCLTFASSCNYGDGYHFEHLAHDIEEIANILEDHEALEMFHATHNSQVGHWGLHKTMYLLNRDYPAINISKEQVARFLLNCHICNKTRKALTPAVVPLRKDLRVFSHDDPHTHRSFISIDWVSLPETKKGNTGAQIIMNGFSKSTRIYPQRSNTAEELVQSFICHYSRYGAFTYVKSDQGSDYMSHAFELTRILLGRPNVLFVHITGLPHRPESHGTEPAVKQVVSSLRKCINDPHWPYSNWDDSLSISTIEMIINFTPNSYTKQVPIAVDNGTADQFFPLPSDANIPDASDSKVLHAFMSNFNTIRRILIDNHAFLHQRNVDYNSNNQQTLTRGTLVYHDNLAPKNKLQFLRHGPHEVTGHEQGSNDVFVRDLVNDYIIKVYSGHLSVFNGTREEAIQASRLDNQQYEITRILGYRGNPEKRTTMEFLILFADGSEVWRVYDKDIDATQSYELFCNQNHELRYLLRNADQMRSTRKYLVSHPFFIAPSSTCYVNLRSWGQLWYDSLNLPNQYTSRYVVLAIYGNTVTYRGIQRVETTFPVFDERFEGKDALDFEWITLWGTCTELDPSWILVDDTLCMLYPQLLPELS